MIKTLFICKERHSGYSKSYGLINSCSFVANYLNDIGVPSFVEVVIDNNSIDRLVTLHKPTHVFIEALWVVPEKFKILSKLHPNVKWIIRIHSKAPFLANEGIAFNWINEYLLLQEQGVNIEVSVNNKEFYKDLQIAVSNKISYTPNIYYPLEVPNRVYNVNEDIIKISSFGANRIQKNQLQQAIVAIMFAKEINKTLHFYMNESKVEKDAAIAKNIFNLFKDSGHVLHIVPWLPHQEFLKLIAEMDIAMQVSLTESFNIVSADSVACDIPTVGSQDIDWLSFIYKAIPTNTTSILFKLRLAYCYDKFNLQILNKISLKYYNYKAKKTWKNYLENA